VEDWRKAFSNPAIKFSDFVSANATTMTMATMTMQELVSQQKVDMVKKSQVLKLSGDTSVLHSSRPTNEDHNTPDCFKNNILGIYAYNSFGIYTLLCCVSSKGSHVL
jgi:hypothetical protein